MRLRLVLLLSMLYLGYPAAAQEAEAYPTVAALEQAVIQVNDPVRLAGELRGIVSIPATPSQAPARRVGERQAFWVNNVVDNREFKVTASLRVVGQHIYMWVEDGANVDEAALGRLAAHFDEAIYQPVRDLWAGVEANPGIDGDPRIHALFANGLGSTLAAYFVSRHTYPQAIIPTSNQHEMLFFNLDTLGRISLDSWIIQSIVAHEFQHMIRFNMQRNEATWVNEGFSSFTQLLLYGDAGASQSFLNRPQTQLNDWAETGSRDAHYGAAMLFTAYFYERFGLEALRALSLNPQTGLLSYDQTLRDLGQPGADAFYADWVLANGLMDHSLYGYQLLPDTVQGARTLATVTAYPYSRQHESRQYAADYYVAAGLAGHEMLDIRVEMPESVRLIPTDAPSGEWLWYSNKADNSETTLTRAVDLRAVTSATLHYRVWYDIEDYWDYAYVMVSRDAGATWTTLATPEMDTTNPLSAAYGPGYTGTSDGWLDQSLLLDAFAGQAILLRFALLTDDAITQPGLALDDVRIPEIGYASDFEADGGGWAAEGWVRTDNRLPQQMWVQVVQEGTGDPQVTRWLAPVESQWTLPLQHGVDRVLIVLSPFAPVTTVPVEYQLELAVR